MDIFCNNYVSWKQTNIIKVKVLWIHNWQPTKLPPLILNSIRGFKNLDIEIELEYLGNLRSFNNIYHKIKHIKNLASDFDLIHSQYGSMCSFIGSYINNKPKILSLHGSDFNLNNGKFEFNNFHTRIARYLTLKAAKSYDHIIPVSERMKKELVNIFPKKKITSIPYPIILDDFFPMNKKIARKKLGIPNEDIIILFNIANLNASVKQIELAKESINRLRKKQKNIYLHVVNNIKYEEVPLHVNASDLILLTSRNEGWPNSIKEALACNVPFVSTDVSDLSRIAEKEESCKIARSNSIDISNKINDVLNINKKYNLRKYVTEMDIQNTCMKIQRLYSSTINEYKKNND
jgi:teichuronic acid biosynthesis glycosyltransferase TuaC